MRRSALAVAVLALAALPVTTTAHAAAGPSVRWAHSATGDLGTLEVSASADAGIASLRAYVVSYATGQDVAVVDEFVLHSGTAVDGVWRTPAPLQLDQLGGYRVDVEATDAAGVSTPRAQEGSLSYYVDTTLTFLSDDPTATYARRSVDVHGVLTGRWPATREVKPIANAAVDLSNGYGGHYVDAITAADGSYRATLPMDQDAFYEDQGFVQATFHSRDGMLGAGTHAIDVTLTRSPSTITTRVEPRRIDRGEEAVLSGRVTWEAPGGRQPAAGQPVHVWFCYSYQTVCQTFVGTATTDADGRFHLPTTPPATGKFELFAPFEDIFIATGTTTRDIVVYQPAAFTAFTAVRDTSGAVTASGRLRFDGGSTPYPIPVEIQFRAAGTDTWTTVATVPNAEYASSGEHAFSATVPNQPSGAWRARYPGLTDHYRPLLSERVRVV
ncbi:hypothetical protein [Saccharothrix luteola]|uniref:hypothetical protein n=1 Tax=Saccharothrix luteola TaxID=2893018 RepID=UPI001E456225|nr:hypothetical protein [Saccharothrix luteola]MCC8244668.1 hypothetical protein [Saccharothrix luteola]